MKPIYIALLTLAVLAAAAGFACSAEDTRHFKTSEFKCHDCGEADVKPELLAALEKFRTAVGDKAIHITSGYRCPKHNTDVGGAKHSQHMSGIAADITVAGMTPAEVFKAAEDSGLFTGIGLYDKHVHVDIRAGAKVTWKANKA